MPVPKEQLKANAERQAAAILGAVAVMLRAVKGPYAERAQEHAKDIGGYRELLHAPGPDYGASREWLAEFQILITEPLEDRVRALREALEAISRRYDGEECSLVARRALQSDDEAAPGR
jgi:hypothetical protein